MRKSGRIVAASTAGIRLPSVRERIARKRDVLREWTVSGVPPGLEDEFPQSFSRVRQWKNPPLGLWPVGSFSDFSPSHPEWGGMISEIGKYHAELAGRLKKQRELLPGRRSSGDATLADRLRAEVSDLRAKLEACVLQWHEARVALKAAQGQLASALAHRQRVERERDAALEELNQLRASTSCGKVVLLRPDIPTDSDADGR